MVNLIIFAGNSNPELARRVVRELRIELGDAHVDRFSDGEVSVEINANVRGADVFLLQSTCAPTNDNVMELIIMADASRRASAARITAVRMVPPNSPSTTALCARRGAMQSPTRSTLMPAARRS